MVGGVLVCSEPLRSVDAAYPEIIRRCKQLIRIDYLVRLRDAAIKDL